MLQHPALTPPPLTADLPGIGGRIKAQLDDFEVEEIPQYAPCGEGEHLYLWLEKRDMSGEYLVRQLGKRLGIRPDDIGTAGLKDRHAVTRQWVSIPKAAEPRLPQAEGDGIRILNVSRHTNKLRPGHLRGNRFRILIRECSHLERIEPIVARIREQGLPNVYGPQRFGHDGETAEFGLKMIRGERVNAPPFRLKLYLSALQSLLFNDYVMRRVADGLFRQVIDGDVMMKWPAGGLFVTEDAVTEQTRFNARELVIGGPMFGAKTFASKHLAAEREAQVLAVNDLSAANFERSGKWLTGTRRHVQVYLDELTATPEPDGVRVVFALPAGSYATVLLGEIMKTNVDGEDVTISMFSNEST